MKLYDDQLLELIYNKGECGAVSYSCNQTCLIFAWCQCQSVTIKTVDLFTRNRLRESIKVALELKIITQEEIFEAML